MTEKEVDEIVDVDIESKPKIIQQENNSTLVKDELSSFPKVFPAGNQNPQNIVQNCNIPESKKVEEEIKQRKWEEKLGRKLVSPEEYEDMKKSQLKWKAVKVSLVILFIAVFAYFAVSFSMKNFSPSVTNNIQPAEANVDIQVNSTSIVNLQPNMTINLPKELSEALVKALNRTANSS